MYPNRIKHVHIHDNYGGNSPDDDLHLPLGKGTIVFESILHALCKKGYNETITLEVAPQFLREGKEKLSKMLNISKKKGLQRNLWVKTPRTELSTAAPTRFLWAAGASMDNSSGFYYLIVKKY